MKIIQIDVTYAGHSTKDCSSPCYQCGMAGHRDKDCSNPNPKRDQDGDLNSEGDQTIIILLRQGEKVVLGSILLLKIIERKNKNLGTKEQPAQGNQMVLKQMLVPRLI